MGTHQATTQRGAPLTDWAKMVNECGCMAPSRHPLALAEFEGREGHVMMAKISRYAPLHAKASHFIGIRNAGKVNLTRLVTARSRPVYSRC